MLINSALYDDGRVVAEPGLEGVSEALERQSGFVWIALRDPTDEELNLLQRELNLPPLAVEDARKGHQRPKLEEYGEILFAAMHLLEPGPDGLQIGEVHVFVGRASSSRCGTTASRASSACAAVRSASRTCCARGRASSSTR